MKYFTPIKIDPDEGEPTNSGITLNILISKQTHWINNLSTLRDDKMQNIIKIK